MEPVSEEWLKNRKAFLEKKKEQLSKRQKESLDYFEEIEYEKFHGKKKWKNQSIPKAS